MYHLSDKQSEGRSWKADHSKDNWRMIFEQVTFMPSGFKHRILLLIFRAGACLAPKQMSTTNNFVSETQETPVCSREILRNGKYSKMTTLYLKLFSLSQMLLRFNTHHNSLWYIIMFPAISDQRSDVLGGNMQPQLGDCPMCGLRCRAWPGRMLRAHKISASYGTSFKPCVHIRMQKGKRKLSKCFSP